MIGQQQQFQVGVGVGGEAEIVTMETLIPGLPDDVALLCIAGLPLEAHGRARAVSRAWRRALQSDHMWRLRRTWGRTQHVLCLFRDDPALTPAEIWEPTTCTWTRLPLMPCTAHGLRVYDFAAVGLGASVYVLGGCALDTGTYPPGGPVPCSTLFRFDCRRTAHGGRWERRQSMRHPRGRLACAAAAAASADEADQEEEMGVIVAAGGTTSLYEMLPVAPTGASRTRAVEVYDVARDEWRPAPDLPGERVGAAAFFLAHPHRYPDADADHPHHRGRGRDFWIMGGYGPCRRITGYGRRGRNAGNNLCTDVAVLSSVSVSGGEGWHRLPPPMYHPDGDNVNGLSAYLQLEVGRVAVIHGRGGRETSAATASASASSASLVYTLHDSSLCRYDTACNRWEKESSLPRKIIGELPYGLVALHGELYVVPSPYIHDHSTQASTREGVTLVFQVYNPRKRSWRLISTKPPIKSPLKFPWAAICSVEL